MMSDKLGFPLFKELDIHSTLSQRALVLELAISLGKFNLNLNVLDKEFSRLRFWNIPS